MLILSSKEVQPLLVLKRKKNAGAAGDAYSGAHGGNPRTLVDMCKEESGTLPQILSLLIQVVRAQPQPLCAQHASSSTIRTIRTRSLSALQYCTVSGGSCRHGRQERVQGSGWPAHALVQAGREPVPEQKVWSTQCITSRIPEDQDSTLQPSSLSTAIVMLRSM